MKIRILNPHGLSVRTMWPTLKAVGCTFDSACSLMRGKAVTLPPMATGIVAELCNEHGRLVEVLR